MGQTLSEPVTEKRTTTFVRDRKFWVGLSDMQGWRISMEDSHTVHAYLPPGSATPSKTDTSIPEQPQGSTVTNNDDGTDGNALFGVFDGHGGSSVAKFAGTTMHTRLAGLDEYSKGDYNVALKTAFLNTDKDLRADPNFFNDPSGCTAVVTLVTTDGRIICANSGDSRAVLGYKGEAKALSHDHKPTNKEETARITSAGGFVEFGRVNGNLALSRALGDFEFKQNLSLEPEKQIVTADPDIITHQIDGEEEFMVIACDGIWDCLTSQQVVDFVRRAVANGDSMSKIAEDMMVKCLAKDSETGGIGCDNMTVVVVALLGGRTEEEWAQWVKERVDNGVGYNTPQSVPDPFANIPQSTFGGLTGSGFRVAGAGGLANIASILGASGITLRPVEDDDSETSSDDSPAAIEGAEPSKPVPEVNQDVNVRLRSSKLDADGDSEMDSGEESDETTTDEPPKKDNANDNANPESKPEPFPVPSPAEAEGKMPPKGSKPDQLHAEPGGDAYPGVAKVEGLMDKSDEAMA